MRNLYLQLLLKTCLFIFAGLFFSCKSYHTAFEKTGTLIQVDSLIAHDSSALKIIAPYKEIIDVKMNEIIAYSEIPLTKSQPEGLLNNYISDLILNFVRTNFKKDTVFYDIAVFNNGGLRASLPRGAISIGDIYKLMPFENEIVMLKLSGENFWNLIKYIVENGGVPFAGMEIVVKNNEIFSVKINGEYFDKSRNYNVITSDFLAEGGDKMYFFNDALYYHSFNMLMREMIIEHFRILLRDNIPVEASLDGRIRYE